MARTRVRAGDEAIVREGHERFARCEKWETTARANSLADRKFLSGDAYNLLQWDAAVRTTRGDRPCLTMNKARQHCLQIVNDARQHKAQIKVTPTGGRATYEAAKILSGIVRRIEYQSKAIDAYTTSFYHQVESGYGMLRVETDYADDESFDQEIFIRRVPDPNTVYIDVDAREYDKGDMRYAFVFDDVPRERHEAEYGKDNTPPARTTFGHTDGWNDEHHVRRAEYWRRTDDADTIHLLTDGTTRRESEMEDGELDALKEAGSIDRSREVIGPQIEWFLIVGDRIMDRKDWPGKYIPLVPVIGEEIVIEGQMDRKGHTRALIDAQRMYNYWSSSAVEQVALQGKSPYIAPARAIEGYTEVWTKANQVNYSVLPYNDMDDEGRPVDKPERAAPPIMAQAYIEGMSIARDDMLMVSGQYQAEFGQPSNERSGVAIDARQRQSDNATYHFVDNQAKAIRQVGRIVLDLIPKIYDTARVTKIMAEDGSDSDVHLVPNAPNAHQYVQMTQQGPQPLTEEQYDAAVADPDTPDPRIIFNPNVGRYDVEADVGPPFGTQRQEAANAFAQIMAQNPAAFQVVGDFWAKNSDFPGADELAERLQRGLPPQYKGGQPDPQVQQLTAALQQQGQTAQKLLQQADAEVATLKAQIVTLEEQAKDKTADAVTKDYAAETQRLATIGDIDPTAAQVIVRSMLSQLLGMPALPIMHEHEAADAAHQQAIAPPDPNAMNGAGNGATNGAAAP